MDILERTGVQLKSDFLIRNGFNHKNFNKHDLVNLMNLSGEVRELTYTLSTLDKTINEIKFGHSKSFIFNDDKSIASMLFFNEDKSIRVRIDYSDFKNNAILRVISFDSEGEEKDISTFEYDEFFNILKTEKSSLHHQEVTQNHYRLIKYKDYSEYVFGNNNNRLYRNGKLIKTYFFNDKHSEVVNYHYSSENNLIKTVSTEKNQFGVERTETLFNEKNQVVEIKLETRSRGNSQVRFFDQKFQYFDNGNIESHLRIDDKETSCNTYYKYDSNGYLVEVWEYNKIGEHNQLAKLSYDGKYNLTQLQDFRNSWKWDISYTYDELGNWIKREVRTHDGHLQIEERNIKYAVEQCI